MLKIENLKLKTQDQDLLMVESFSLLQGKSALIVGGNRTGKSLFLKILANEYENYKGNIMINGKSLDYYKTKNCTILIDETPRLFENETILKNISFPFPRFNKRIEDKLNIYLEMTGLEKKIKQKVALLSLTEKRLVEIIRSVLQLPYLIMIDDYDSSFDVDTVKMIKVLLEQAASGGTSFIATARNQVDNFAYNYLIKDGNLSCNS